MAQSAPRPLPYRIRAELFAQLAQLEIAGLPYDRATAVLKVSGPAMERLVIMQKFAAKGVDAAAAGERSGLFTKLETRLVRAALNAGSPAGMYRRLADYYTARALQVARIKSRLMMPGFTLILALFIQPLPQLVGGTIGVAGYLWKIISPLLFIGAIYTLGKWFAGGDAHSQGKSLWQKVPFYGPIFVRRNLRDFFESLALMLEAGISMLDALPAALETVEDGDMRRELSKIRQRVEKGLPLADALRGIGYIDDERVIEFTQTGEASGSLPEMLLRHTKLETEAIAGYWEQVAEWVPRIVYAMVAAWMVYGLMKGAGVMPRVPSDL
jgi:general secretion pathway protein F